MALKLATPNTTLQLLRERFRTRRLALDLSQHGLAARSGVSLGSLKRFEHTGQIALESLLKLALVLDCLDNFQSICTVAPARSSQSLDQVLAASKTRSKGRKR